MFISLYTDLRESGTKYLI